jgi:O-antigen/teichoic acid export membrane protein
MSGPPARDETLTGRTLSGLRWSYLASGVNAIFQVVFTAVLARLLLPEAFGVVAMAAVILRFGAYFAQMGVGRAVIQRLDLTQRDERAAFTASVLLGAAFTALFWVAAPLALHVFDDPQVVPILRVTSLTFLVTGLSTTSLALLQRQLRFRAIAVVEIVSYAAVYGPVGVVLALSGAGPWSLVAAGLGQSVLTAILAYAFCRHSLRPSLGRAATTSLLSFGARVSGISLVEFLTLNLNPLWIGNRLGATPLGVYNRAFSLVNAPAYYFTTSLSRVLFSSLSRVQTETAKLRSTYLSVTTVFAALLIPVCWGAAAASREIVLVVLGPNWTAAIPVFAILAAIAPIAFLAVLSGVICEVTATLNPKLALSLGKLAVLVVLLIALGRLDLIGYTLAYAVTELFGYLAYFALMRSVLHTSLAQQMGAQIPGVVVGLATAAAMAALGRLGQAADTPQWLTLAAQLTTGGAILLWSTLRGFSGAVWAALGTGLRWSDWLDPTSRSSRLLVWLDAHSTSSRLAR